MNSLFIRVGNQIINRELVCGVEYKKFSQADAKFVGAKSRLTVFTTDGKEVVFKDENADLLWDVFNSASLSLKD